MDGSSLGTYAAPVRSDAGGLSFVGVMYADPLIARVRITLGTGALGPGVNDVTAGGTPDLVGLGNVIYGEPHKAFQKTFERCARCWGGAAHCAMTPRRHPVGGNTSDAYLDSRRLFRHGSNPRLLSEAERA